MTIHKPLVAGPVLLALAGCTSVAGPLPGTVEYAAATVSRAYDCGLRVDRGGIIARLDRHDRQRFVEANARYAVDQGRALTGTTTTFTTIGGEEGHGTSTPGHAVVVVWPGDAGVIEVDIDRLIDCVGDDVSARFDPFQSRQRS